MRKVDRAGVLDDITDPVEDLSLITGMPEEHVSVGLEKLIQRKVVVITDGNLLIPNFIEAQESSKSDRQRQRESRERRRRIARTDMSQNVTDCHSATERVTAQPNVSPPVTPTCAVPTCAVPSSTKHTKGVESFARFWAVYPRKADKKAAFVKFKAAIKRSEVDVIIDAASAYAQKCAELKTDKTHIKLATTWLNGDCWENDLGEYGSSGTSATPKPSSEARRAAVSSWERLLPSIRNRNIVLELKQIERDALAGISKTLGVIRTDDEKFLDHTKNRYIESYIERYNTGDKK
jgi:hypothetical protein